jgi:serine/threonine protein kinase/formylglycine-generating enzyme required for sulfatase activity
MTAASESQNCPQCGKPMPASGFAGLCAGCVASSLQATWDTVGDPASYSDARPAVPGWEFIEPVGAGAQGTVWRALRLADSVMAAVKVFRLADEEVAARLDAESAALKALDHPAIVRVLESGETIDGRLFIATEFVEGCDLSRLLSAERLLPERALGIAQQVAAGLAHSHEKGVVHRDLKPANVLVGHGDIARIADFSLANRGREIVTLTREGTTFGTPYYLAPEVLRSSAPATAAADIFALGVMLYEMLTGSLPAGRFAPASTKCAAPREVDALLELLLAEKPEDRPASAELVVQKIAALRSIAASAETSRIARRRWTLAGAIALVAGLAAAAGYFAARPVSKADGPPKLNAKSFPNPAAATRAEPFVNGLGMSFIPVSPTAPLFARHETKLGEYRKFIADSTTNAEWQAAQGPVQQARTPLTDLRASGWENVPGITAVPQGLMTPNFPDEIAACGVNLGQARRFCAWLTWREQREGRLSPGEFYRLPTDEEWSVAAGIPSEPGATPEARSKALAGDAFPWSTPWPPPKNFGNYAGTEARNADWPQDWLARAVENDAFPRVAPPGSFAESATGLFDLWGNVWEWCDTRQSQVSALYVLRGGSWVDGGYRPQLRMDYRRFERQALRETTVGFRCVLVVPSR